MQTRHEEDLIVLGVALDVESGHLQWSVDAIEATETGETDEHGIDVENDEEDDD